MKQIDLLIKRYPKLKKLEIVIKKVYDTLCFVYKKDKKILLFNLMLSCLLRNKSCLNYKVNTFK